MVRNMISVVIGILNQFKLSGLCLENLLNNANEPLELILIDDGSDYQVRDWIHLKDFLENLEDVKVYRNERPTGSYYIMKRGFELSEGDIIAFFHSDLIVWEQGWDRRVKEVFEKNEKLGLVGFIGSTEIDSFGGRGMGTISNFQGREIEGYKGSRAEIHGGRIMDFRLGAVVDGCSMIFRKKYLEEIGFRDDFPPHHFYDRLFSCQVLEKGYQVGILGIACDHISGQVVNQEKKYHEMVGEWLRERYKSPEEWVERFRDWFVNDLNPNKGKVPHNNDAWAYMEAERQFLTEYRDQKHFIPLKVEPDGKILHL